MMLSLLKPGGVACFAHDMVSSDAAPQLRAAIPLELPALVTKLVAAGNYIHGGHPDLVDRTLAEDAGLRELVASLKRVSPWLWRIGPERYFLVNAFLLTRADVAR